MDFVAVVDQAIALLRQRGRLMYRTLQVQLQLAAEHLAALTEALIEGQHLAVDEASRVLAWSGASGATASPAAAPSSLEPLPQAPLADTPPSLAEKMLTSRTLEGFTDPAAPDMPGWHDYVRPYLDHNWLQVPWFFAETYFYRRLIAMTDFFRTAFDPFAAQKQQGLHTTVARGQALATQTHRLLADGWRPEGLIHVLTLALWGNQADMSLWAPDDATQPLPHACGPPARASRGE